MGKTIFSDTRNTLGIIVISLAFLALFILMFHSIPKDNSHLVDISLGFLLGGAVTSVMGYFFSQSVKEPKQD